MQKTIAKLSLAVKKKN